MKERRNTPSFVLTLKLNTTDHDGQVLAERFFYASRMRNLLIAHARRRLRGLRQDTRYRALMAEYIPLKEERDRLEAAGKKTAALADIKKQLAAVGRQLSAVRMEYGLSEYQFHSWISVQQNRYRRFIDSFTAQKTASQVWHAVESVLFRKGKTIHFKSFRKLMSLEGKSNHTGIRYTKGKLSWLGLTIQPRIRRDDRYAAEALKHRVKYCRIQRKAVGTSYHWYLQLVLEGIPPVKHEILDGGRVGIDQGISTEAVVSENGCLLAELCRERPDIQKKARQIQRRMDRSARATNPGNYRADGTVKRGVKWIRSKAWRRDRMRLNTLYRKAADHASQSREDLANTVLCRHGSDIITEQMNYKALQARAKETSVSEKTGRFKRKKRFGASIGRHAPAAFMNVLERKLSYIQKTVNYVDTGKYRASQYRHDTDTYEKQELSDREKYVSEQHVQRDLYSAFLLMCARDQEGPEQSACRGSFPAFLSMQKTELIRLLHETCKHPSCMGLDSFRYLLTEQP